MKKILFILSFFLFSSVSTFAATQQDKNAADFLAKKNIITLSSDYKLDSTITRREMLKVMMNLSGKPISSTCTGKFKDLPSSDWGCKYAEAALANGYISANNNFRPDDAVTEPEVLKMISQAKDIEIYDDTSHKNWWDKYVVGAKDVSFLREDEDIQLTSAPRSRVFYISARTFFDSGVGVTVEGIYEHCHLPMVLQPCIKIDNTKYPLVHTNQGYLFITAPIFSNISERVTVEIVSQERAGGYSSLGMGYGNWSTKVDFSTDALVLPENLFDTCGNKEKYELYEWWDDLENMYEFDVNDIKQICYSQSLGMLLLGLTSQGGYSSIGRFWTGDNTAGPKGIEPTKALPAGGTNTSEFVTFQKRFGEIIPIVMKDKETQKESTLYYNFVQDAVVEK